MSIRKYRYEEGFTNHCYYCQKFLLGTELNSVHYDLDGSRYYCDKCRFTPPENASLTITIQILGGSQKTDVLHLINKLNLWLVDDNELWEFLNNP